MQRRQFLQATLMLLAVPAILPAATGDRNARCLRLANRMAELRLKMRLGYTARQGRVYRQKLAALEAEQRLVCR